MRLKLGRSTPRTLSQLKRSVRRYQQCRYHAETLAAGSDDEEEEERTVYQKKRLLSLEVARASRVRGVGAGTSHSHENEIAHRPELTAAGAATSSNSDTD